MSSHTGNPSIHPSLRATLSWEDVQEQAESSAAVKACAKADAGLFVITWVDGSKDEYTDPQAAVIAIREMGRD